MVFLVCCVGCFVSCGWFGLPLLVCFCYYLRYGWVLSFGILLFCFGCFVIVDWFGLIDFVGWLDWWVWVVVLFALFLGVGL